MGHGLASFMREKLKKVALTNEGSEILYTLFRYLHLTSNFNSNPFPLTLVPFDFAITGHSGDSPEIVFLDYCDPKVRLV